MVSTHSRLKAAGLYVLRRQIARVCFNTQPPEGGWKYYKPPFVGFCSFNTQPPEGGWDEWASDDVWTAVVSTHSRLKAAGL